MRRVSLASLSLSLTATLLAGCPTCGNGSFVPTQNGQVSILNKSHEMHRLEFYPLRPDLVIDCDVLLSQPQDVLRRDVFAFTDDPWRVELFSGQEVSADVDTWLFGEFFFDEPQPASFDQGCKAALVQSAALPDLVIFWATRSNTAGTPIPDFKTFLLDEDIPKEIPADDYTLVIDADYSRADPDQVRTYQEPVCDLDLPNDCTRAQRDAAAARPEGARYTWRMVATFPISVALPDTVQETSTPPERCQMPGDASAIAWERLPGSSFDGKLLDVRPGEDGCHDVLLETVPDAARSTWSFCAPRAFADVMEPQDGEDTRITIREVTEMGQFAQERKVFASVIVLSDTGVRLSETFFVFGRGTDVIRDLQLTNSPQAPVPRVGCAPEQLECGQITVPFDMNIGPALGQGLWRPGTTRQDVSGNLYYLGRSRFLPFYAPTCTTEAIPTGRAPTQRVDARTFVNFSLVPLYTEVAHVRFER